MTGFTRLREAIERHKENKDINIKYKTPLTGKVAYSCSQFYIILTDFQYETSTRSWTNKPSTMPVTQFKVTEKYEYTHGFAAYNE